MHNRYLIDEVTDDMNSGHNIVSTVFVDCGSMYTVRPTRSPAAASSSLGQGKNVQNWSQEGVTDGSETVGES